MTQPVNRLSHLTRSQWLEAIKETPWLSPADRKIVSLRLSGRLYEDIGAEVGYTRQAVSGRFSKAFPMVEKTALKLFPKTNIK